MHYEVLENIEYSVFGEMKRASKGSELYIPIRAVVKELLKTGKIRLIDVVGEVLSGPKPAPIKPAEAKTKMKEGSLVKIADVDAIGTVVEILNKQVKVEYSNGETKRVAISRVLEVLD
jgi:hypothetical protein